MKRSIFMFVFGLVTGVALIHVLEGPLDYQLLRREAGKAIGEAGRASRDLRLATTVRAALALQKDFELFGGIDVKAKEGEITLSGTVGSTTSASSPASSRAASTVSMPWSTDCGFTAPRMTAPRDRDLTVPPRSKRNVGEDTEGLVLQIGSLRIGADRLEDPLEAERVPSLESEPSNPGANPEHETVVERLDTVRNIQRGAGILALGQQLGAGTHGSIGAEEHVRRVAQNDQHRQLHIVELEGRALGARGAAADVRPPLREQQFGSYSQALRSALRKIPADQELRRE